MLFVTYTITKGQISIPGFVGMWAALSNISNRIYSLIGQLEFWPKAIIDIEKLWELFDRSPAIV